MKRKLEQYRNLKSEITDLEERIVGLRAHPAGCDVVRMSDSEFPYLTHASRVTACRIDEPERERLSALYRDRLKAARVLRAEVEEYIMHVDDSLTRCILTLRYIDGLSWPQVALRTHNTPDSARMIATRYCKKAKAAT